MPPASCPACRAELPPRARFCPGCGAPAPEPARSASEPAGPALPLDLFTVGGMSSLAIDRAVTLGRSKANILVEHQDVAPTHCRLTPRPDGWLVEDLSGEGVFAGPTPVAQAMLRAGEAIDVGGFPGAVALALPGGLGRPLPLELRSPDGRRTRLVLQKLPMVIGRGSWVDLPLGDRNVSHAHARLRLEQGRVVVDDLQSRNGTFVGGDRVKATRTLRLGDVLRLGDTEIVFGELEEAPSADALPGGLSLETPSTSARTMADEPAPADLSGCPACGEPLVDLARGGVITGAWRLARTAVGMVGAHEARSEVGRCAGCGARLAICPTCGAANSAPSLVEQLVCRRCDSPFVAG